MLEIIKTSLNKMKNMFTKSNDENITITEDLPFDESCWVNSSNEWQSFLEDCDEYYIPDEAFEILDN